MAAHYLFHKRAICFGSLIRCCISLRPFSQVVHKDYYIAVAVHSGRQLKGSLIMKWGSSAHYNLESQVPGGHWDSQNVIICRGLPVATKLRGALIGDGACTVGIEHTLKHHPPC